MSLGPYPDFAWSVSRYRTLQECARKYFYSTYGMWGGWEDDASAERRLAYRLKKLESLDASIGTAIHRRAYELTTLAQEGQELPSADALREQTRSELGKLYRADRETFLRAPKNEPMLRTFYYGDGPSEKVLERVRTKLENCLPHLRNRDLWGRIRDWEIGVAYASNPDQFTDPVVEVDGVPVYADPDLLLRESNGDVFTVLDWKTGVPRERDQRQIAVYGLAVRERFDPEVIKGRLVYLLDGSGREVELRPAHIRRAEEWIRAGIEEMRGFVADPEVNRPRPKDDFPLTQDRRACGRCPYFEMCEEELRDTGPLPWEEAKGTLSVRARSQK